MRQPIYSWLIAMLAAAVAAPALAAPTLFSGNVTLTSSYRKNFYTPSGPDPCDYGRVFVHVGAPAGVLSVTANGALTVPASTFTDFFTSSTTEFPGYPSFYVRNTRIQRSAAFAPGFLTATETLYANTTSSPNLPSESRQGVIRLIPGPDGFGGYMAIYEDIVYSGRYSAELGSSDFLQYMKGSPGDGPVGAITSNLLYGYRQHTSLLTASGLPHKFTYEGVGTNVPWITGTLTQALPSRAGYYSTVRTVTVYDSRVSPYSGAISLVSARLLTIYSRIGGTVQERLSSWGRTTRINLVLMPEPGRLVILTAGFLGLFALGAKGRLSVRAVRGERTGPRRARLVRSSCGNAQSLGPRSSVYTQRGSRRMFSRS